MKHKTEEIKKAWLMCYINDVHIILDKKEYWPVIVSNSYSKNSQFFKRKKRKKNDFFFKTTRVDN